MKKHWSTVGLLFMHVRLTINHVVLLQDQTKLPQCPAASFTVTATWPVLVLVENGRLLTRLSGWRRASRVVVERRESTCL